MTNTVYGGISADPIHPEHINATKRAAKHGDIVVGKDKPACI